MHNFDPSNCGSSRGAHPVNGTASSGFSFPLSHTWEGVGTYTLPIEQTLFDERVGSHVGRDTIGLQLQDSVVSVDRGVIAGIATKKDLYLGQLSLGTDYSDVSGYEQPLPSLLWTMKNQSLIPSLSYGYTAGASYKFDGLPGSLTLGGYDKSRFDPSNVNFTFSSDVTRNLTVGVQSITANNTLNHGKLQQDVVSFTSGGHLTLIDSTVPHIWLPIDVCNGIQHAFGLNYDDRSALYTVNNTVHTQLVQLNAAQTFRLGNNISNGHSIDIVLPYRAFDLVASAGYPYANATYYFPIRRAANDSQYTIGRTFLQEAYLIVDYERSTFSVNQATTSSPLPQQQIVLIAPVPTSQNQPSSLSVGVIVGIVIGVILVIALISTALLFYFRRKRRRRHTVPDPTALPSDRYEMQSPDLPAYSEHMRHASGPHEMYSPPLSESAGMHEMDSPPLKGYFAPRNHKHTRSISYELDTPGSISELPGSMPGAGWSPELAAEDAVRRSSVRRTISPAPALPSPALPSLSRLSSAETMPAAVGRLSTAPVLPAPVHSRSASNDTISLGAGALQNQTIEGNRHDETLRRLEGELEGTGVHRDK
ncbi:hypothetical protein B0A49_09457 [Cryomyces minteri]|uniref:Peptidase A1 domain-containing protein n=1 Tax=Cryomyces minteri TaxID=331657 RepID=A0A4U0WXD1_9PEZI|nr:hypothetical protein B0A49_09457 [Cryomyces minteri]